MPPWYLQLSLGMLLGSPPEHSFCTSAKVQLEFADMCSDRLHVHNSLLAASHHRSSTPAQATFGKASCFMVNSCSSCRPGVVVQMCMRKRMQPRVLTRESSLCQQRQVHLDLAGCGLTTIYRPPSSTWASRAARQTQQVPAHLHAHGLLPLNIAACSKQQG